MRFVSLATLIFTPYNNDTVATIDQCSDPDGKVRRFCSMEQHPVPQNVTSFQFRLIGDMTLKQFGYLAVCSVVAFICYKLPLPSFFTLPLAVGMFLFGFGLAFVPIEERPMDVWVLAFLKSIYSPTQYVWRREPPVAEPASAAPPVVPQPTAPQPVPRQAPPVSAPVKQPFVSPSTTAQALRAVQPVAPPAPQPAAPPPPVQKPVPVPGPKAEKPPQPGRPKKGFLTTILSFFTGSGGKSPSVAATPPPPAPPPAVVLTAAPPAKTVSKSPGFLDMLRKLFAPKPKEQPAVAPVEKTPPKQSETVVGPRPRIQPEGPDVFAGVKTPSIVGQTIDLPKAEKQREAKEAEQRIQEAQRQAEAVAQKKTNELEGKLRSMQEELKTKSMSQDRILELQKQLTEVLSEKSRMENEMQTLRMRLENAKHIAPAATKQAGTTAPQEDRGPTVRVITAETAVRAGLPKLTTFPNVVTGIIKDYSGNLLPGVLVTVRDTDGTPVRALKTNKLGQFAASTPLPNNTYVLEVEDPRNRFVFDRIQITLNGSLVPAIEVVAKSEKELSRKKLEDEIFGKQQM